MPVHCFPGGLELFSFSCGLPHCPVIRAIHISAPSDNLRMTMVTSVGRRRFNEIFWNFSSAHCHLAENSQLHCVITGKLSSVFLPFSALCPHTLCNFSQQPSVYSAYCHRTLPAGSCSCPTARRQELFSWECPNNVHCWYLSFPMETEADA